jgi:hypothetical protein
MTGMDVLGVCLVGGFAANHLSFPLSSIERMSIDAVALINDDGFCLRGAKGWGMPTS